MGYRRLLLVILVVVSLGATVRLDAITYGFVDPTNAFGNTGAFIVKAPSSGQIFPICSGTLISPTVFLTASHCTAFFESALAPVGYTAFVSFYGSMPFGSSTSRKTALAEVTGVVTNPNYNQTQSDPGDIAVVIVNPRDVRGITPAALPREELLEWMAAARALDGVPFTNVGYNVQNRNVGGGVPYFRDVNLSPACFPSPRSTH